MNDTTDTDDGTERRIARSDANVADRRTADELERVGLEISAPGDVHREVIQRLGQLLADIHRDATADITGDAGRANKTANLAIDGATLTRADLESHGLRFACHFPSDGTLSLQCTEGSE